jgi:hypothetical protein
MFAPIALVAMSAEGRGPAIAESAQRLLLLTRKHVTPASQEVVLMGADHIGHFRPMSFHPFGGSNSSGLVVARTVTSATCK